MDTTDVFPPRKSNQVTRILYQDDIVLTCLIKQFILVQACTIIQTSQGCINNDVNINYIRLLDVGKKL